MRFVLAIFLLFAAGSAPASVDLHSHLFMHEGMGLLMRGGFDDRARATDWTTRLQTRISKENLDKSQLRIVVISYYAHPIIQFGKVRESILKQIEMTEKFVKENPAWVIASNSREARAALIAGKRVFVLSLETARGTLDTEADRVLFLETKKISIVTPFHLSPDRYGSPSLYYRAGMINTPIEWFKSWSQGLVDRDGININPSGVWSEGRKLIEDLVAHKVWVDLSHASDRAQDELQSMLGTQPALYTHTIPRKYFPTERGISEEQILRVIRTRGIIGLIPSEDMHEPLLVEKPGSKILCKSGPVQFAKIWKELAARVGANHVMLGTDFNSPLHGVSSECASDENLKTYGFKDAAQIPAFLDELKKWGAPIDSLSRDQEEAFLEAWSKVRP